MSTVPPRCTTRPWDRSSSPTRSTPRRASPASWSAARPSSRAGRQARLLRQRQPADVVVVPPTPGVVVVLEEPAVVEVVVEVPVGALVAGVVLVDVVVGTDVVVVVDVVEDVVVVVAGAGDGDGVKMSCTLVPLPPLPKTAESGWPEISSMAVTNMSAITKTMAAVPAIVFRLNVGGVGRP